MRLLKEMGAIVIYTDNHVPVFTELRKHYVNIESRDPTPDNIIGNDPLLIVTNNMKFDYQMFKENAQLIVDTRGVFLDQSMNIVKA